VLVLPDCVCQPMVTRDGRELVETQLASACHAERLLYWIDSEVGGSQNMAEKISRACVDDDGTGDDVGYLSGAVLIGRNSRKLTNLTKDITSTNHIIRPIDVYINLHLYLHK
jgi:hypothetical protein